MRDAEVRAGLDQLEMTSAAYDQLRNTPHHMLDLRQYATVSMQHSGPNAGPQAIRNSQYATVRSKYRT